MKTESWQTYEGTYFLLEDVVFYPKYESQWEVERMLQRGLSVIIGQGACQFAFIQRTQGPGLFGTYIILDKDGSLGKKITWTITLHNWCSVCYLFLQATQFGLITNCFYI